MLKQQKNVLFRRLQEKGFDVRDFEVSKAKVQTITPQARHLGFFRIRYAPGQLVFDVLERAQSYEQFDARWSEYRGGRPNNDLVKPAKSPLTIEEVAQVLSDWLDSHVMRVIQEEQTIDLWEEAAKGNLIPDGTMVGRYDTFDDEEKEQVRLAVRTFGHLLVDAFNPVEEQLANIAEQLEYLNGAVDRLNRFDWKGVAINTLMSITIALNLDVERGRQVYVLFQQAFAVVMHLLGNSQVQ